MPVNRPNGNQRLVGVKRRQEKRLGRALTQCPGRERSSKGGKLLGHCGGWKSQEGERCPAEAGVWEVNAYQIHTRTRTSPKKKKALLSTDVAVPVREKKAKEKKSKL